MRVKNLNDDYTVQDVIDKFYPSKPGDPNDFVSQWNDDISKAFKGAKVKSSVKDKVATYDITIPERKVVITWSESKKFCKVVGNGVVPDYDCRNVDQAIDYIKKYYK